MGGASWGYMNVRLLLSVDYPEGMDTSPIRAALLSCGEEGATACVGHALWAQGALAFKRGDVQDVTWEDQRVGARVRAKGVSYRSEIEYASSLPFPHLRLKCACFLNGDCTHTAALLQCAIDNVFSASEERTRQPAWNRDLEILLSTDGGESLGLVIDAHDPADPVWLTPVRLNKDHLPPRRLSWAELAQSRWGGVIDALAPEQLKLLRRLYQCSRKSQGYISTGYDVCLDSLGTEAPRWLYRLQCGGITLLTPQFQRFHFELSSSRLVIDMNLTEKNLELTYHRHYVTRTNEEIPFPRRAPHMSLTFCDGGDGAISDEDIDDEVLHNQIVQIPTKNVGDFLFKWLPLLRERFECTSSTGTFPVESCQPKLRLILHPKNRMYAQIEWALEYHLGNKHFRVVLPPQTKISQLDQDIQGDFNDAHALLRHYFASASLHPSAQGLLIPLPQVPAFIQEIGAWPLSLVQWDIDDSLRKLTLSEETATVTAAIEATDSPDWWGLHVAIQVGNEKIPISRVLKALSSGEEYIRVNDGQWARLEGVDVERLRVLLRGAAQLTRSRSIDDIRLHASQLGLWESLSQTVDVAQEDLQWRSRTQGLKQLALSAQSHTDHDQDPRLRPYQLEGRNWLHSRISSGFGCILADDMGLGKTRQVLAAIDALREEGSLESPVLILVPTSVISSWADEAASCFPQLRTCVLRASHQRNPHAWDDIPQSNIVITSHTLFRMDHLLWSKHSLSGLVIDEAQVLKNPRTILYRSVKELHVPWRICMSGTPIENSLEDLWALMSLSVPGLLSTHAHFNEKFRRPIEGTQQDSALELLHTLIAPFILRRTKEEVTPELPDRIETLLPVPLEGRQRQIYDRYLTRERARLLRIQLNNEGSQGRFEVLAALTRLRQLSLDPALVDERYEGVGSAKINLLCSHLEQIVPAGHQVLVFSQFVSFLERIDTALKQRGISCLLLEGKTRKREEVIAKFRRGEESVFLISLKAGGVGLTLTEADYVYIMDPWWNPSVEAQAINRAHRIGQDRAVNVYRLVAQDTIEEKVCQLQAHKQRLIDTVVDDVGDGGTQGMDIDQLIELLGAGE